MKALIQRVSSAKVEIDGKMTTKINRGLLVFVGIEKADTTAHVDKILKRILSYRVFADENNKMNLSVKDIDGDILLISQFTLAADTQSGTRAGFSTAKPPVEAEQLYYYFAQKIQKQHNNFKTGIFGANMQVSLINDGPVTFLLSC